MQESTGNPFNRIYIVSNATAVVLNSDVYFLSCVTQSSDLLSYLDTFNQVPCNVPLEEYACAQVMIYFNRAGEDSLLLIAENNYTSSVSFTHPAGQLHSQSTGISSDV